MWEIAPSLVRYDVTERTSADLASLGLKTLAAINKSAKVSNVPFKRPVENFYQTDVISRACVSLHLFSLFHCTSCLLALFHGVQVGDDGPMHTCIRTKAGIRKPGRCCRSGLCIVLSCTILRKQIHTGLASHRISPFSLITHSRVRDRANTNSYIRTRHLVSNSQDTELRGTSKSQ